jgi:hypothetical protein
LAIAVAPPGHALPADLERFRKVEQAVTGL